MVCWGQCATFAKLEMDRSYGSVRRGPSALLAQKQQRSDENPKKGQCVDRSPFGNRTRVA